jgi:hypothetical protein
MSDYGFSTKDQNGDNAINAKNPIFGFDMGHRPMAFKTFRFNDVKTYPIQSGNPATPNPQPIVSSWSYDETQSSGEIVETLLKRKHGYNFRPVGYAVITGTLKISSHVQITQTQRAGTWGGNYTKTLIKDIQTYELTPNQFNHIWISSTGTDSISGSVVSLTPSDFSNTIWSIEYPKRMFTNMPWGLDYGTAALKTDDPIWVEFDDQYIYIKRKRSWTDCIRRCKYTWYDSSTSDDIQERVKATAQFTGSRFDVTVYLCPYPLKELL